MLMSSFRLTKEDAYMLAGRYKTPLEVISTDQIEENYTFLKRHIPRLKVFYAIKANPADCIINKMIDLGSNFDVASAGEINKLRSMGVAGSRMIYANPVKHEAGLVAAAQAGITRFTFDSRNEIEKLAKFVPNSEVLARVKIENSEAAVDLNTKFGAEADDIVPLLQYAKEKGLQPAGICFHIGSQSLSSRTYLRAFVTARRLIDRARQNGIDIKYMDIGGGLPAPALHTEFNIKQIMRDISRQLDKNFQDVEVWAEPGRYICASAVNLLTSVVGIHRRSGRDWYFLDDGIYGCFSGVIFDHWDYDISSFKDGKKSSVTLAGPSCDSIDIVKKEFLCPQLEMGDLLLAVNSGAYSRVSATTFNGFALPQTIEWEEACGEIDNEDKGSGLYQDNECAQYNYRTGRAGDHLPYDGTEYEQQRIAL